jgi:hypothetical protein
LALAAFKKVIISDIEKKRQRMAKDSDLSDYEKIRLANIHRNAGT